MKVIGGEVREIKKEVVELFSSICMSELYTMKFHLLYHLVEDTRNGKNILVPNASTYALFNVRIKTPYRGLFKRRATVMQKTVTFMSQPLKGEQRTLCTEVESS